MHCKNKRCYRKKMRRQRPIWTAKNHPPNQSQPNPPNTPGPPPCPEQVRAVAAVLAQTPAPLTLSAIELRFKGRGPWKKSLPTLLQTLEALGRARAVATDGEVAWRG